MRKETKDVKKKVQSAESLEEKINILKNSYNCEECYIITAGPSFNELDHTYLKNTLKDKLVISVKQTYNILKEVTDIHLLNPYNYQPYLYEENEPIVMYLEISGAKFKLPSLIYDFKFEILKEYANKENSLSIKRNFDNFLLDKSHDRPFGPGIMHELAIYLPVLLNIKKVFIIGWDLGVSKSNKIERFYSKNKLSSYILDIFIEYSPSIYNKLLVPVLNKLNYFLFLIGFNRVLNNPGVSINEADFIAESTWDLYNWYKAKGIDLLVVSNKSMLDYRIPRVKL